VTGEAWNLAQLLIIFYNICTAFRSPSIWVDTMISLQEFLKENLIFIIVPVVLGVITIIHDFVPTWLFLGGGFALLGGLLCIPGSLARQLTSLICIVSPPL
jgi:hypothetical protein